MAKAKQRLEELLLEDLNVMEYYQNKMLMTFLAGSLSTATFILVAVWLSN